MALLGAHMSIAGGLDLAIERGNSMRCEAIQIFVRSSRTWQLDPLKPNETDRFQKAFKNSKTVKRVVAHNSYLLNISTPNSEMRKKSIDYFTRILEMCEALGVESLITHPGSHQGEGEELGIANTIKSLSEVMRSCRGYRTRVLIENTAGQGACVGYSLDHVGRMVQELSDHENLGVCLDTQHAFAAGYDLRTDKGYDDFFKQVKKKIGLERVCAFHLNDSIKDFGCRVDRHANIGKGFLGKNVFQRLMNDSRFQNTPMCLETDPGEEMANWKRELKLLRSFRD